VIFTKRFQAASANLYSGIAPNAKSLSRSSVQSRSIIGDLFAVLNAGLEPADFVVCKPVPIIGGLCKMLLGGVFVVGKHINFLVSARPKPGGVVQVIWSSLPL
jgi:hypothetical protein